jgi:hypothetical protein
MIYDEQGDQKKRMEMRRFFRQIAKSARACIRRAGFDITRYPLPNRRGQLEARIARLTENTVSCGLFTGLVLPEEESSGDRGAKLLGLYEKELEPALQRVLRARPDVIVNIGCAEGFYAVGLARLIPNVKVSAYDIDERARQICKITRRLNGVNGPFEVRGYCSAEELQTITQAAKRPFVLVDCEGGERELLLSTNYDYANAAMLIECHDFIDGNITRELIEKFSKTHTIELIEQGEKNPFTSGVTKGWSEDDLWLVVSERRPEAMHWLSLSPLGGPQNGSFDQL